MFIAGFICYRLSGVPCADIPLACRSLLYDVENRCWSEELAAACGISLDTLPAAVPAGTKVGSLLPQLADELGLPRNVQVVIGVHDQIVNALGAGVQNVGDAVDTSGTCECITPLFEKIPEELAFQQNNFACVPYLEDQGYVTYEMRYNQEKLRKNGVVFKRLYACGGGARSAVWLQIKADVLDCDIIPVQAEENGAMGSAILGIAAVTGKPVFEVAQPFWRYGETVKPKADNQKIYDEKYARYCLLRKLYRQYSAEKRQNKEM